MNAWRVILQLDDGQGRSQCIRYDVGGVTRPSRISVVACDPSAAADAAAVHAALEQQLLVLGARATPCGHARDLNCMAWGEPSCQQILVLIVGQAPIAASFEQRADAWLQLRPDALVIPALASHLTHAQVFAPAHRFPKLSTCTTATWGGSPAVLATAVFAAATLDERPGVFVSYRRDDATAAGDVLHDRLVRGGFRVFVDRFTGTQGRVFPQELAEAMASMGLVVLLETSRFQKSDWSMWEARFAWRYRLGPIAINFQNAPKIRRTVARTTCNEDPATGLTVPEADRLVAFIRNQYVGCAQNRLAFYEGLVDLAAQSKGGSTTTASSGIVTVTDGNNVPKALALPHGVPGRLRHAHRLMNAGGSGVRVLAGEHQHLPRADADDLTWLAAGTGITLAGSSSIYRVIQRLV